MSPSAATAPTTLSIPLTNPQRWRAFWVCVSVAAITILDLTKVNVAVPSIEASLGASPTALQLVVSGYVLTFGLALVPFGRIGDQWSRRGLFIIGLALFTLASAMCALAPDPTTLMIGRLVQGVAAGIQMPQVIGTIQQLFQGKERGRAFGLFGATIGISTAFGPTLGGLLIALGGPEDGWRWIFWMNVPPCLAAIGLAIWVLPSVRKRDGTRIELDPVGVFLFAIVVISLMWPFLFTTGSPDDNPARWWALALFAVFGVLFFLWERRYAASGRAPLVPFGLFRIASYRNGTLIAASYFTAAPALFLLTTLFLQLGLGLEPVFAGMVGIGFAVISAVGSWVGGNLVNRFGRPLVVIGLAIILVAVIALTAVAFFLPPEIAPYAMAGVMAVGGLGGGLVIAPNQTLALADIPVRDGGLAGSVGQLGQRIGSAIGTAVGLSLFYSTIYREVGDGTPTLSTYHDAYAFGMGAVVLFLLIALVLGILDIFSRRRETDAEPAAS